MIELIYTHPRNDSQLERNTKTNSAYEGWGAHRDDKSRN